MKTLLVTFWQSLWTLLRPTSFYSWQASLWMSLLAWLLAQAARAPEQVKAPVSVHDIMTSLSWMFLILAVGWLTQDYPLKLFGQNLGPWITGALVCLFLFVRRDYALPRAALISWPLFSAAIAAFPEFIDIERGFSIPRSLRVRQNLCIMLLVNLLLTSWITFSFRINHWLMDYPGIWGEGFDNSFFLMQRSRTEEDFSRGREIIQEMEQQLNQNTTFKTQSEVERWLLDNQNDPLIFRDSVMNSLAARRRNGERLPRLKDDSFWQLETLVSEPAYQVELRARWVGPRSKEAGHLVKHSCKIDFGSSKRANVTCPGKIIAVKNPNDPESPTIESTQESEFPGMPESIETGPTL
jgi:hypothetical protein